MKDKNIIRIALQGRDAIEKNSHLQTCARCRDRAGQYLNFLSPSREELPAPDPGVETRIMATRYRLSKETVMEQAPPVRLTPMRILFGTGAAAAIMALTVSALLFRMESPSPRDFTIVPREGLVRVNGLALTEKMKMEYTGKTIRIQGAGIIRQHDGSTLSLQRGSALSIEGKGEHLKKLPRIYSLTAGSLTADIRKDKDRYIFRTAHADTLITGTRFRISTGEVTRISLHEGSLSVTARASGVKRLLSAGQHFEINKKGLISEIIPRGKDISTIKEKIKSEEKASDSTMQKERRERNAEMRRERREIRHQTREERREMNKMKRSFRRGRER